MTIHVISSVGYGSTLLSAFDKALVNAGVHNYNLIPLSSIIPPSTVIKKSRKFESPEEEFGDRLYVVMSNIRSNDTGKYIAAGIGWYQLEDKRGFFVEHHAIGSVKKAVKSELSYKIHHSLRDMCKFRKVRFFEKKLNHSIAIANISDQPTCALTVAVYVNEKW